MSNLIPFKFNTSTIRTLEVRGDIFFIAKDVAECLGYEKPSNAIHQHCKKSKSLKSLGYPVLGVSDLMTIFGTTSIIVIPESDVYRLTMRSKLESAEKFQDWVVEEVLPSIRKNGSFNVAEQTQLPKTLSEALKLAYDQSLVIEQQQLKMSHKDQLIIALHDASIKAGEVLVREFCKSNDIIDLGQNDFYEWMRSQGYILKNSTEPYQKYEKLGYFKWRPSLEEYGGKIRHQLFITPRGKVWLAAKYMAYLDSVITA
jgi:prophage antirepressor-like protein